MIIMKDQEVNVSRAMPSQFTVEGKERVIHRDILIFPPTNQKKATIGQVGRILSESQNRLTFT
jgi:hypothetical protein